VPHAAETLSLNQAVTLAADRLWLKPTTRETRMIKLGLKRPAG